MSAVYPNRAWSVFSLEGKKNNFKLKNEMLHTYNELTQGFIRPPEGFKKFMEAFHNKLDYFNQHVYEKFFYDLLYDTSFYKVSDGKNKTRWIENSLILLNYYSQHEKFESGIDPKYSDFYETNLDCNKVNIEFLRNLWDEAAYRDNLDSSNEWAKVFMYLNKLSHCCMKHSFDTLNYDQINQIMGNYAVSVYSRYLFDEVDSPSIDYSKDHKEHRIEDTMPVLWAMALNQTTKAENGWQEPFKFDHMRLNPDFIYSNILDFFINIKIYQRDFLKDYEEYERVYTLDTVLNKPFYAHLLLRVSLNEDERLKHTLEMLDKGFGDDFFETNNITLSEYYHKMHLNTGSLEYKIKGEISGDKEEELACPEM